MDKFPARAIAHSPRFEEEFAALEPDAKRRDQILQTIDLALSRRPDKGRLVPVSNVWIKEMSDPIGRRRFSLYYTFNEKKVVLLSVTKIDGAVIWPS